ncbi:MAG: hypothetical protein GY940_17465, partial [bacterium]|nr:hypothetical protein [bacterium]
MIRTLLKLIILLGIMLLWFSHDLYSQELEIHYINVQQGQSILIIGPEGTTILLDGGKSGKGDDEVVPYLKSQGINTSQSLDYIIATHLDKDHIAGLTEVMDAGYDALKVYYNGSSRVEDWISDFYAAADSTTAGGVTVMSVGDTIKMGSATVTCVAAKGEVIGAGIITSNQNEENDLSVALLIQYGDFDYLVHGDAGGGNESCTGRSTGQKNIETPMVRAIMPGGASPLLSSCGVEVAHVAHHGSESSTNSDFMNLLTPTVACISVGAGQTGTYYHPRKAVVENVLLAGAACITAPSALVLQTEEGKSTGAKTSYAGYCVGDIVITTDGISTYSISASGAVSQGPDERSSAGLPATFNFDECNELGVLFSEVLYDSRVNRDTEGEWIELYNSSSSAMDIGKWTIKDVDKTYTIPDGTTIGPGCYVVISDGSSVFNQEYGCNPHFSNMKLQLNNNGGYLKLRNRDSDVMDQVAWGNGGSSLSGWGNSSNPYANEGKSIVRSDLNNDTNTYADWLNNRVPDPGCGGTPRIDLGSTQLSFVVCAGDSESQTFSISNSGCGTLNWSVTDNAGWLSCSPASGSNSGTVTVTVNGNGLSKGVYQGTVSVSGSNASNSPAEVAVNLEIINCCVTPQITLNRTRFNFGSSNGLVTRSQPFLVSNTGCGTLNWTVTDDSGWLSCTPGYGRNSGRVSVSVNSSGLAVGTYTGTVMVKDPNAANSPRTVSITLNVNRNDNPPFGTFATPAADAVVRGSIPVTGWVLDDIEVGSVKIYREEGRNRVYIGDAQLVESARPDVERAYPGYPVNYKAGWGYMLLTNFLPNQGNGPFSLLAIATDTKGQEVTLGTKTITCDNMNAVKPFGAIDTPTQGGTASGGSFINWGWALTPQPNSIPTDGSTINVWIDGVKVGRPSYNVYRSDIASLFPGYANSNGAVGYFYLDTTAYSDGVHVIQWTASDSAGNSDGIGSRYFLVQNQANDRAGGTRSGAYTEGRIEDKAKLLSKCFADHFEPVRVKKGYKENIESYMVYPEEKGTANIWIKELQRVAIHLGQPSGFYSGYLKVGNRLRRLPVGSTLDGKAGVFYWQPGPGFIG